MRRRIAPAVLAVTALFALSGCFKMDTEIEVHADDTVSGSMVMAMEKDAMEAMSSMGSEGSGEAEDFFKADDVPEGATVEAYDDGEFVGQKMTFEGIALADLMESADAPDDEKWSLTHEGDIYTFKGAMDMTYEDDEAAMMEKMMKDAELRVAITFPGKITDTNGDVDGHTVVWHPKVGEKNVMTATATEGGFPVLPLLGGLALLALMAGGAFVLYQRHGAHPAAGLPTAAPAAAHPGSAPAAAHPAAPAAPADGLDGQWGPGQD